MGRMKDHMFDEREKEEKEFCPCCGESWEELEKGHDKDECYQMQAFEAAVDKDD